MLGSNFYILFFSQLTESILITESELNILCYIIKL